jgi:hypothetical protein
MHFWGVFGKDEFRIQGTSRDRSLFMVGGGTEEKRVGYKTKFWVSKRLGKWKTEQLKGWVMKVYCHFQSMTHSRIYTKRQCQQPYVINTICKSIRDIILIIFRFVRRKMVSLKSVHMQTTWNIRLQKIAQIVIKLMSQEW